MLDKASKKVMLFQFLSVVLCVLCVAIIIVNLVTIAKNKNTLSILEL